MLNYTCDLHFCWTVLLYSLDHAGNTSFTILIVSTPHPTATDSFPSLCPLVPLPTILHPTGIFKLVIQSPKVSYLICLRYCGPLPPSHLISFTHLAKPFPRLIQLSACSAPTPEQFNRPKEHNHTTLPVSLT